MTTKLSLAAAVLAPLVAAGCVDAEEKGPTSIGLAELSSATIVLTRDGAGDVNPLARYLNVELPTSFGYGHEISNCPRLSPTLIMTRDGRRPDREYRGGGTHETWGDTSACDSTASASFLVPGDGGPMVIAFDDGPLHAEIEVVLPAREPFTLVGHADGRARLGETLELQVPGRFFADRNVRPPTLRAPEDLRPNLDPLAFDHGLFVRAGTDASQPENRVQGAVGVTAVAADGTTTLRVIVPAYAAPGEYELYVRYNRSADWVPLPVPRCDGFAGCTATMRDNFDALGPRGLTIE